MNETECLLCDVVNGTVQAEIVLETKRILVVASRLEALAPGHCVFFPKRHTASLHEADDADLAELLPSVKRVAGAMGIRTYNVLQNNGSLAGQTVFHAHVHLIPKPSAEEGLRRVRDQPAPVQHGDIFQKVRENLGR